MASAGAVRAGKAFVELGLDKDPLVRGLKSAGADLKRFGASMTAVGKKFMALGGAILAPISFAVKKASDMQETMSKFETVFGNAAKGVKRWGDELAGQVGRSRQQIASFLASSQDLFVPLGFDPQQAQEMSKTLTKLAIDLASFNNMADADAMRDLQAALTGSGEVMKKYGVIVSEAAVKQELLNQNIDPKTATDTQKVMARLNIILAGTTAAQGDAQRTAGSFANQLKRLWANVTDVAGAIGEALLPILTELAQEINAVAAPLTKWVQENQDLIVTTAKLAAGMLAAGAGLTALGVTIGSVGTALKGLSAAIALVTAHPLVAVLTAAGAAAVALTVYLSDTKNAAEAYADEMTRAREATEKAHAAECEQAARLVELSEKQRLSSSEMQEAGKIIADLEGKYGDLGLSIDKATGKIVGMTQAQQRLLALDTQKEIEDLEKEYEALYDQMNEGSTGAAAYGRMGWVGALFGFDAATGLGDTEAAFDNVREFRERTGRKIDEVGAELDVEREKLRRLQGGERLPLEPEKPTAAKPGAGPGEVSGAEAVAADLEKSLQAEADRERRLAEIRNRIRLQGIRDAKARELAEIDDRYDREVAKAREANDLIAEMELENLRMAEKNQVRQRYAEEQQAEQRRAAEDQAAAWAAGTATAERTAESRRRAGSG